jgi:predicted RNA-binding protein
LLGLLSSGISFILQAAIKPNMGTQDYNVYEENIMSTRIDWLETRKHFIIELTLPFVLEKWNMCEFTVFLDGKTAFKDVVFAKMESNKVVVKDVLGQSKEFKNCKITEVDVNSTRLILSSA